MADGTVRLKFALRCKEIEIMDVVIIAVKRRGVKDLQEP